MKTPPNFPALRNPSFRNPITGEALFNGDRVREYAEAWARLTAGGTGTPEPTEPVQAEEFTPTFLQEQRKKHSASIDQCLIESVKKQIQDANLAGCTHLVLSFTSRQNWESTLRHFEDRGFAIKHCTPMYRQQASMGGQEIPLDVLFFEVNWDVKEEPESW